MMLNPGMVCSISNDLASCYEIFIGPDSSPMKLLSLIGALLLSGAPVQSQPNFLYSDICKKSEENLKGCKKKIF